MPRVSLPTFPSFDLSSFDLRALDGLDDKVVGVARDAAYIALGFGILAFQQAQVRRREVEKAVSGVVRTVTRQGR